MSRHDVHQPPAGAAARRLDRVDLAVPERAAPAGARMRPAVRRDWAGLALACGYFDQAHLIHDFRAFSGLTPTAYEARRTAFQNHVTFLQSTEP